MKKNNWLLKIASVTLIGAVGLLAACKEEDRLTVSDTQDITEEAVTDSYFQDMDDMSGVVVGAPTDGQFNGSGRTATSYELIIQDERMGCDGVSVLITPDPTSTVEVPKGVIVINFGTEGCVDNHQNVRTGKLILNYYKRRFQEGSTVTLTTENYFINGIKLEGTRTSTNVSGSTPESPKFHVTLANGKATFPDNSVATRTSDITWQWVRDQNNPTNDQLIIDPASASGTTRGGRSYTVNVLEALKYKRFCGIAVDGIKQYVIDNSKQITIDYGDGTCDKSVTITVNGVTRNINVN